MKASNHTELLPRTPSFTYFVANFVGMRREFLNSLNIAVLLFCLSPAASLLSADPVSLDPQLEPFRPVLEKTWKGAFKSSKPEKPVVDIMRWERALNGKAVRVLHSVNEGSYGGETIFRWDQEKQAVTYHYFTTAGFMTVGSVRFKDGKWITHEVVAGRANGVTEVRATADLSTDGALTVKTEHLKDGTWEPGREITYTVEPAARVVFK